MTIFISNMKRILRDKMNMVFMFVFPLVYIVFAMVNMTGSGVVTVGIVDNDNTEFTKIMADSIKASNNVVMMKEGDVQQSLINGKADWVIVIGNGYTKSLIDGEDVRLKSYSIKDGNASAPVRMYLEGFLDAAKNIAEVSSCSSEKFYCGLEYYRNGSLSAGYTTLDNGKSTKANTMACLGFLAMSMLFFSSNAASLVLEDKKSRTFYRMFSTPLRVSGYMLQNILSFLAAMILQVIAIFAVMILVFKADFGPSVFNMMIMFSAFAVVTVSIGVAISSISRDTRQAGVISTLTAIPLAMLGGCLWPRDLMPEMLKRVGDFIPTSWALEGAEKILYGGSLLSVSGEILVLLLFAAVFFLIGMMRKADVIK